MSQGQNEQQDGWKGLTAITATDTAERPEILIRGDILLPSHVYVGGNSRKSSLMTSGSMEKISAGFYKAGSLIGICRMPDFSRV
jgi:hypothetical protein